MIAGILAAIALVLAFGIAGEGDWQAEQAYRAAWAAANGIEVSLDAD